ncbi:transcription factor A, mitochondrial [Pyxicephalus adspersus]|uniref:Transcription factor A, mitochondrial n=1 Tax=Pyxicephalus adspersus TaxID=30357 RepID=A0AAV2ZLT1_PYXAD|nr:TPA: hypothetical protein GDO54_004448 [Pyxicephalus adspersus]
MVSLLCRGVGVLVKSLAGLSSTQTSRCSSLPCALSTMQCATVRWFSNDTAPYDFTKAPPPKAPPKRPLSSFFRFLSEQRPILIKKHPEATVFEISKMIGNEWRALPEAERQAYIDAARAENMKYREVFNAYKESLHPIDIEILKDKRKQRLERRKKMRQKRERTILGQPKRCRSAFNIYLSENYSEAKGDTLPEKMKSLRHEWDKLPSSKKQVYVQLAEDDKIRYLNEVKAWEEQMIEIGREDLVRFKQRRILNKSEKKTKEHEKKESKLSNPEEKSKRNPRKYEE